MIHGVLRKLFGTRNDRELKRIAHIIEGINTLEPTVAGLDDAALQAKTAEFRGRIRNGESVDDLLHEAFAVCREASRRVLGMRHYDVQLIGGIVLHEGKIAEMKTGEGKTLVATLPVYLNALEGRGVHVITVNDYLARRDAEWMGKLYGFLGLSVGVIVHGLTDEQRQAAYGADITYGTNNEFGFDYLRDNMKYDLAQYVQRELNFTIVDEVDSILIDEARTPLIISGPSEESTDKYYTVNRIVPRLVNEEDFTIDEKARSVVLTEEGNIKAERLLGDMIKGGNLYDPANMDLVHHVLQGLRAHHLFQRDVDYVVNDEGEVVIVDEFTGRMMPGRRWSDGLHQAIEAKEGVKIANENQTLATITFQNFFRMYHKLSGMTGTADTEAEEFAKIYNLDVVVIPTHRPMVRKDNPDLIYKNVRGKFNAIIEEIAELHAKDQPVLVGTISIEASEVLSKMLKKKGIAHNVLNAKQHAREAEIVTQAGQSGTVTIATNMAGRGTDIVLGGNHEALTRQKLLNIPDATDDDYKRILAEMKVKCEEDREKVLAAGGLFILGTERHESRRIDNQLRGRSGRQGDPGGSRFYLSLEDDLMRIFGSDRVAGIMDKLGLEEDMPIEHSLISRAVEGSQKKVEAHNFDIRKHLLEYDDVMNNQRLEIYSFRREILSGDALKERALEMAEEELEAMLAIHCPESAYSEEWDIAALRDAVFGTFDIQVAEIPDGANIHEFLTQAIHEKYDEKERSFGNDLMRYLEKMIMLQVVDTQWKDHLLSMDHLKEGIGLRGYGQRDPLTEYKKEAYEMFGGLRERIEAEVVTRLFKVQVREERQVERSVQKQRVSYNRGESVESRQPTRVDHKVGRNDSCPCGSGKKFKKCCGK
jgi:preprotein translocase subunit SecA